MTCIRSIVVTGSELTDLFCPQGPAAPPQHHVLLGVPGAHVCGHGAGAGLEALLHPRQPHGGHKIHRQLARAPLRERSNITVPGKFFITAETKVCFLNQKLDLTSYTAITWDF